MSLIQVLGGRVVGTVEEVSTDRISVLLDPDAPQATALNTGFPTGFPRINGHVLIPNETGATTCIISSVRIERLPFPKRRGNQQDYSLVDLAVPIRVMSLTPIGTLRALPHEDALSFEVRRGVDVFPSVGEQVLLPGIDQLRAIVEGENSATKRIHIGSCPTAGRAPVYVDPDKLFGRHLAVLGNTGAGKSCTVAGLVRWSLEAAARARSLKGRSARPDARFILLDPNGEYAKAFQDHSVRVFRVEPHTGEDVLHVPAWLWNGAEWAAFTDAAPGVQRPVLFEALRRLRSQLTTPNAFETKARGRITRYRNMIKVMIQSSDHLQAGRREGVADALLQISEGVEDLVSDPKCTDESIKNALQQISNTAKNVEVRARSPRKRDDGGHWHNIFSEVQLGSVTELLEKTGELVGLTSDVGVIDEDTPIPFPVSELSDYIDALATDVSGRDIAQFIDTLRLRIRGLMTSGTRLSSVLRPDDLSVNLEDWLTNHIGSDQAENGPVTVIDLSLVPSEVIHIVVSVLARMIFEALQRYRRRYGNELPTTLVLEEAHTFVHRDLGGESAPPVSRECARVFERIAREGRKFGLGLVLASQRPSEVSQTVLSQCNTFLLHRLVNDRDQELVKRLVPDGLGPLLRELPSLPTRRAILLGWAAPAPTLVEVLEIPEEHRPHSPDPAFWDVWTGEKERRIDWAEISDEWQRGSGPDTAIQ